MRRNKKLTIVLVSLLLAVLGISCGIIYTNAKYTSSLSGNVSVSVAKWAFDVSLDGTSLGTTQTSNFVIADTCDSSTLVDGKIAPGTSGSFDIIIDATGSEVAVNYNVSFVSNSNTGTLPKNLVFKLDGQDWSFDTGFSGTIAADAQEKTVTHSITWSWAYETVDGDVADTSAGTDPFNSSFTITAVGTQANPQE